MIYKFKSKSAGDVIMMAPSGDHVMRILGREPAPQGIIESADMPAAIERLEQAVKEEEAARAQAEAEAAERGETLKPAEGFVTLRQRVWPLVEMMKRSHAHGHDIVWGV